MGKAGIACSEVPALVPPAPTVELVTGLERRKLNGEMHWELWGDTRRKKPQSSEMGELE